MCNWSLFFVQWGNGEMIGLVSQDQNREGEGTCAKPSQDCLQEREGPNHDMIVSPGAIEALKWIRPAIVVRRCQDPRIARTWENRLDIYR